MFLRIIHRIDQSLVVFINQNYYFFTRLFISCFYQICEPSRQAAIFLCYSPIPFVHVQYDIQRNIHRLQTIAASDIEIDVNDRIFNPIFFQFRNSQTLKQFSFSQKVGFQRRNKKAFPKPARASKIVNLYKKVKLFRDSCIIK